MRPSHDIQYRKTFGSKIEGFWPTTRTRIHIDDLERAYTSLAAQLRDGGGEVPATVEVSEQFQPFDNAVASFVNSTVGGVLDDDGYVNMLGSTVGPRCPGGPCNEHGDTFYALPLADRLALNCATAYCEMAFGTEGIETAPEFRYMFIPGFPRDATDRSDVVVMEQVEEPTEVRYGGELVMRKLEMCHAVVISERWLRQNGNPRVTFGFNGADASLGLMTFKVPAGDHGDAEMFFVPFCTEQKNLGRRDGVELAQPLATAMEIIAELRGFDVSLYNDIVVDIEIGASATLAHFKHEITLPTPEFNGGPNGHAVALADSMGITYEEYVDRYEHTMRYVQGKISYDQVELSRWIPPKAVMEWRYPGSLAGGFVYGFDPVSGELEVRTEDGCPGFYAGEDNEGNLCHLDYRGITEDTIRWQLSRFGVAVRFGQMFSSDSSDPSNNLPSNRAEQLAGIGFGEVAPQNSTSRGFVGVTLQLSS